MAKPSSDEVGKLSTLHLDVIGKQATINIGTIGHVSHGKTSLVRAMSGIQTTKFHEELRRNITMRLGYANCKIYKCPDPEHAHRRDVYTCRGSKAADELACPAPGCSGKYRLIRHVSFVDCPGHDYLTATMLTGAAIMDAALLVVAADKPCPQPQTAEHLSAINMLNLRDVIIVQNKMDLVTANHAKEQYNDIKQFVKGTTAEGAPVVPVSAQFEANIDMVCEKLVTLIPVPERDHDSPVRMTVVRSFDVNKPGCGVESLQGGVAGGSIHRGVLRLGDEVEMRPGVIHKHANGSFTCHTIRTRVTSLLAELNNLQFAVPGGLIGVGTKIDPTLCRADRLVGQVLGAVGSLPPIYSELLLNYQLVGRLDKPQQVVSKRRVSVPKLSRGEHLRLNVGALTCNAQVVALRADLARVRLSSPVCAEVGDKVALSRKIERGWRLIGWGQLRGGTEVEPTDFKRRKKAL